MTMHDGTDEPLLTVDVRSLAGTSWQEQWPKGKLAYLILMADLDPPTFERSLSLEWVPYDANRYRWDKAALAEAEFANYVRRWPGQRAATFDPNSCERIQFRYGNAGAGFDPTGDPALFEALLTTLGGEIRHSRFEFSVARHLFQVTLNHKLANRLLNFGRGVRASLRSVDPGLPGAVGRMTPGAVVVNFVCRDGSFEPPFTFWSES
jgi:hypothetical protein